MLKKLLIVESPAKAKTIAKYLGDDFSVKSSVGHIRDLPKENGAIKIADVGDGRWKFEPKYEVVDGKEKVVNDLKSAVKSSDEIYLASDPDREGEAIAWHLKAVLEQVAGDKPFRRVTYNEITKSAVLKAVAEPREIDMPLVDAQQARRIIDRLVGYKVSPLLWKNINCPNNRLLSAGRVQSVALRLLVERQREIDAFKPETFFLMGVEARKEGDSKSFIAKLSRYDGEKPDVREQEVANKMLLDLAGASLSVADVKEMRKARHAIAPFTTSTLQQAASSALGFSPGKTMKFAQSLYEQGRITYMRSDSVSISEHARQMAKDYIVSAFGEEYYPQKPNYFALKAKSGVQAQEAHEAIRPTDVNITPQDAKGMDDGELKLYDLIWRRFVASQMADAKTTVVTISLVPSKVALGHSYLFTASATRVDFDGFLKVMKLSLKKKRADGEDDEDSDEVAYLPLVSTGDTLEAVRWISEEKKTKGPSNYSEASLIKALEENGVGRPSTYAATIETLKTRQYAKTSKKKFIPLDRGVLVCDWLVKNMDSFFNVGYTAEMEAELDQVEERAVSMDEMLSGFYRKFLASMPRPEPPPPIEKFKLVFELLDKVSEWKPAKKIGKKIYDDKAFFESCRKQLEKGDRTMSRRQLEFLVRMAMMYSSQIPDCETRLKEANLSMSHTEGERADPELVGYCFNVIDRIGGMLKNPFIKSLHDQWERGKSLSPKQFSILVRTVAENSHQLDDADQIRERLGEFAGIGQSPEQADPAVGGILKMLESITEWRAPTKRGKHVYDDHEFVKSIGEQFERRRSLSPRQISALKRVAVAYRSKIPDFKAKAQELGLEVPEKHDAAE